MQDVILIGVDDDITLPGINPEETVQRFVDRGRVFIGINEICCTDIQYVVALQSDV